MEKKIRELRAAGAKLPKRPIKRQILSEILPWLDRKEIIVVTGPRQSGKSVLLYQLIYDHLLPKNRKVYYFNLDVKGNRSLFEDADNLLKLIENSKERIYVFIDEVQRLKEPGLFLKGIYDLQLPIKLIVSGSSALEIKSKIHEALTGRKAVFHLNPFNLPELSLALFPKSRYAEISKNRESFQCLLEHFLIYGGYPAVVMEKNKEIKIHLLKEIFESYMEKDVKEFLKVENINNFRNLIKILSSQIGNLINKEELSSSLGIHKNTLDNYLFYLEQTYVMDFVPPFFRNKRKEILKSPKVYFRDLGFRNCAIGSFEDYEFRPDFGALLENIVYLSLKDKLDDFSSIHFWRTKAGAEVDFVIEKNLKPIPLEVKAAKLRDFKTSKSFMSFITDYGPPKAYFINLSLKGRRIVDKTKIIFLTLADLIGSEPSKII